MTPVCQDFKGSKIKGFSGSNELGQKGANARAFSRCNCEGKIKAYFAEWKRLATFAPKYLRNFGANKC